MGSPFEQCRCGRRRAAERFLDGRRVRLLVRAPVAEGGVDVIHSLFLFYYFANLTFVSLCGLGRRGVGRFFSRNR